LAGVLLSIEVIHDPGKGVGMENRVRHAQGMIVRVVL
jgi:hypothetical protein